MIFESFFRILSLQVGVVLMAIAFIVIAFVILTVNLNVFVDYHVSLILIVFFLAFLEIAGVLMVAAAYKENLTLALIALLLIVMLIITFLIGSGISFYNRESWTGYICVEDRCPESLWLVTLSYRKHGVNDETVDNSSETSCYTSTMQTTPEADFTAGRDQYYHGQDEDDQQREDMTHNAAADRLGYEIGAAFIIAIVLFVVNLSFVLFCALLVFSYYQELNYILISKDF